MKMISRILLLGSLFLTFSSISYSQRENAILYFGDHYGIEFKEDTFRLLDNSSMYTYMPSNSLCDKYGNLLFYSDGNDVYNAQHQIMPNGANLGGDSINPRVAFIPHPGFSWKYFLIYSDAAYSNPNDGLFYAEIDMLLDNGLGDVTQRGIQLCSNCVEAMSVVRHCNKQDFWLISHSRPWVSSPDQFYVWHVRPDGISTQAITSLSGGMLPQKSPAFSEDGTYFYAANLSPASKFSKYSFDRQNGAISMDFSVVLATAVSSLILSPNKQFLYIKEPEVICQYKVSIEHPDSILDSRIVLSTDMPQALKAIHTLQNKIIWSSPTSPRLSTIHLPNNPGLTCNFELNQIDFGAMANISLMGLPEPIVGFQYANGFTWDKVCLGDTTEFQYLEPECGNIVPVEWNFGDINSANNTATGLNPKHHYASEGFYTVQLIVSDGIQTDTLSKRIQIVNPEFDLGDDIFIPADSLVTLDAGWEYFDYQWSTGAVGQTITVQNPGWYAVQVKDKYACLHQDSLLVSWLSDNELEHAAWKIYPNPTSGKIYIDMPHDNSITSYKLFNLKGMLLQSGIHSHSNSEIDIARFEKGMYILQLYNESTSVVYKIILNDKLF